MKLRHRESGRIFNWTAYLAAQQQFEEVSDEEALRMEQEAPSASPSGTEPEQPAQPAPVEDPPVPKGEHDAQPTVDAVALKDRLTLRKRHARK